MSDILDAINNPFVGKLFKVTRGYPGIYRLDAFRESKEGVMKLVYTLMKDKHPNLYDHVLFEENDDKTKLVVECPLTVQSIEMNNGRIVTEDLFFLSQVHVYFLKGETRYNVASTEYVPSREYLEQRFIREITSFVRDCEYYPIIDPVLHEHLKRINLGESIDLVFMDLELFKVIPPNQCMATYECVGVSRPETWWHREVNLRRKHYVDFIMRIRVPDIGPPFIEMIREPRDPVSTIVRGNMMWATPYVLFSLKMVENGVLTIEGAKKYVLDAVNHISDESPVFTIDGVWPLRHPDFMFSNLMNALKDAEFHITNLNFEREEY